MLYLTTILINPINLVHLNPENMNAGVKAVTFPHPLPPSPNVPVSPCPTMPPQPHVPLSPCSQDLRCCCPHVPLSPSPCPSVSMSLGPVLPMFHCPHVPLCLSSPCATVPIPVSLCPLGDSAKAARAAPPAEHRMKCRVGAFTALKR